MFIVNGTNFFCVGVKAFNYNNVCRIDKTQVGFGVLFAHFDGEKSSRFDRYVSHSSILVLIFQ